MGSDGKLITATTMKAQTYEKQIWVTNIEKAAFNETSGDKQHYTVNTKK